MKIHLKTHKILLVEDYSVMRVAIKEMLYRLEAKNIIEADNANQALSEMEKDKFDIVLCDYNLGMGKNGQQLLEEAKYRKLLPFSTIFIMVTAEQTQSMVLSAMDNKPDDYLTKPFNSQQLITRLEKHLRRKAYLSAIEKAIEKENLFLAISHCEQLLQLNDPGMRTHLSKLRAELAIKAGDLSTAEYYYQGILKQRELAWARHGLGVLAFAQHNFEQAIQHFKQVISCTPMMMECYDWLANAYEMMHQPEQAQAILNKALDLSPQAILRQQKLAALADKTGNLDVARQAYKSAIRLGQYSIHKSCSDFSGLARIYCKTNDTKEALKIIDTLRKEFENNPEAELRAALQELEIYTLQNNAELTKIAYAKIQQLCTHLEPIPHDLTLDIAKIHYLRDNIDAAHNILDPLIKNNIDDEHFIHDLRAMHQAINQNSHAETLIQRAKQELIDINNKGVGFFKQGQLTEALNILNAAAKQMPTNKTIMLNIATILIQDMKHHGITKEKLLKADQCIKKALHLGASYDKIGGIQMEFSKLVKVNV